MPTNTEEILIRMGMDTASVRKSMDALVGHSQSTATKIGTAFKNIATLFTADKILEGINKVIEHFDDLKDRADNLGVSTDFLQGASAVAGRDAVGGVETFNKAIAELSVKLGAAKDGSDEAVKKFQKFGITIAEIQSLDAEGMFYLIADRIKGIQDPAQRANAAFELLGKAGKNLTGVLANGSGELKKMVDAVDKLDADKIKQLAEAKDRIENVQNTLITYGGKVLGWVGDYYAFLGRLSTGLSTMRKSAHEEELQQIAAAKKAHQDANAARLAGIRAAQEATRATAMQQYDAIVKQIQKLAAQRADLIGRARANNFETVSIQDLAGRDFVAQRQAMYGEGGQFDLGRGNGRFNLVAKEFVSAEYAQKYARAYGTETQALAAQERMNRAQKILENYGVKLPGADTAAMRKELEGVNAQLAQLYKQATTVGLTINTKD